ncbi:unnamed protein product, partial [Mesorhabditis belari]|uniref:Histone-lysine N-methyltransferase SETMAR n=1 Tax=Mesorhabditis belari TaxID=2138241 RepID=A0AAF3F3I5_9BILA
MLCVWWKSKGLVYFEVLDSGQTVTANLYQGQLDRVDQALRRQGVDTASTKFLHDNARPHVAKITQQKIEEMGWEVLPHPPYSPDLAPSDYHLLRSMHHINASMRLGREKVQEPRRGPNLGVQLLRVAAGRVLQEGHPFSA